MGRPAGRTVTGRPAGRTVTGRTAGRTVTGRTGRWPSLARSLAVATLAACGAPAAAPPATEDVRPLPATSGPAATLDVTHGRVERLARGEAGESGAPRWRVSAPSMRAVVRGSSGDAASLDFIYTGPTAERTSLASGHDREQIGLKLRAQDTCNVIYVMWRVGAPTLAVQLKRNSGARTHAECGNRGYQRLRGEVAAAVPPLVPGDPHVLAASIENRTLVVTVDGRVAWRGVLPDEAMRIAGPAGMRSDNVRAELSLTANGVTGELTAPR